MRPGFKYPWVVVIQEDEEAGDYAWGVYSQGARATEARWSGHESTVAAARHAAAEAAS